jgi:hypothetical protein
MDTTEFDKEIEKAMSDVGAPKPRIDVAKINAMPAPRSTRPWADEQRKPEATSLTEQWNMHLSIGQELRDRLRKEKAKILTEHDMAWLELRHRYEQRISDTIADMRAELEAEQRRMVEAYQAKSRELDLLAQRVEDDG